MAASDSHVFNAKGRLSQQGGEPDSGYITPGDIQLSFDDLQDGWQADIVDLSFSAWLNLDSHIADSDNDFAAHVTIANDGTLTTTWPDRLSFSYADSQGASTYHRTGWFNEYGEIRAAAAESYTIPLRVHGHTGGDSTNDIFQVRDQTGGSVNMLRVGMTEAEFQVPLTVVEPTAPAHAASKQYVDGAVAGFAAPAGRAAGGAVTVWHQLPQRVYPARSVWTFDIDYPHGMDEDTAAVVSEYVAASWVPPTGLHEVDDNFGFVTPYTTQHPTDHADSVRLSVVFPDAMDVLEGDGVQITFLPR